MRFDAVLLASFGGPEGPADVIPFLERVTAGRDVSRERLDEVARHYLALGGVSPINAQNRALIAALEDEFARRGRPRTVYWGNRNSAPSFSEALRQCHADGHRRVFVIPTSAYSSYSGCRQYREDLAQALAASGLAGVVTVAKARPYYDRPGFIQPFAVGVADAMGEFTRTGIDIDDVHVLFTTHAIPESMARTSGPPGGPSTALPGVYGRQHMDVAARVMDAATSESARPDWSLAFQSRSGPPHVRWLEPDVNAALARLAATGFRAVIVVPIGFVSDHVEVVWDLDREAAESAARLGLQMTRVRTPGTDPGFVSALSDLLDEANDERSLRHLSAWETLCVGACCPNERVDLPAVPAV